MLFFARARDDFSDDSVIAQCFAGNTDRNRAFDCYTYSSHDDCFDNVHMLQPSRKRSELNGAYRDDIHVAEETNPMDGTDLLFGNRLPDL